MSFQASIANGLSECLTLLSAGSENFDRIVAVMDSIVYSIETFSCNDIWLDTTKLVLEQLRDLLAASVVASTNNVGGRPKLDVTEDIIQDLFSLGFTITASSKLLGISRMTLYRRLSAGQVPVRTKYKFQQHITSRFSTLTATELDAVVVDILTQFPNSGYRRVQGYLQSRGVYVQQHRIRSSVKRVDPGGVFQRTMASRIIVRRKYYVEHSNDVWHIDTHMKLVRWKITVRGGIDGKSRLIVFLEADNNNKAVNNLSAFIGAVEMYGLPSRTRQDQKLKTDKGLENILIARYMLETRGINRASHICGKSVHNQRIERLWRDVFYGLLALYYNVFMDLEEAGILNINNPKHIAILHLIFIPRINEHLREFANGYNAHPLRTESNKTPCQLFLIHLGNVEDSMVDERNLHDWNQFCNSEEDVQQLFNSNIVTNPENEYVFTAEERHMLALINPLRESVSFGADIYQSAMENMEREVYV